MTTQPRTQEEIYESLEDRVSGEIPELTDWTEDSPNYILVHHGYADAVKRLEHRALAVQLSGWIDYAGGPIDESDLRDVGVDASTIDIDLLNEFTKDEDLDHLVAQNSATRLPGTHATGEVEFTVMSGGVTISEGTEVSTIPDSNGDYLTFTTDEEVSTGPDQTTVIAPVTADSTGTEYNVGSETVQYLPSPPPGVQGVTNPEPITGGENEETNDELRERAKSQITRKSEGGTLDGIKGGLADRWDDISIGDVIVKEMKDGGPKQDHPYADVYVDGGGSDDEIEADIDELRPIAVRHYLERPSDYEIMVDVTLSGNLSQGDRSDVEENVREYISGLGLGERVVRDKIIQRIMNTDSEIDSIEELNIGVENEEITYTGDKIYKLGKGDEMTDDGIIEVVGPLSGTLYTFEEDTDYQEGSYDEAYDAIDWTLDGYTPDQGSEFAVDYIIEDDVPIDQTEKPIAGTISVQI